MIKHCETCARTITAHNSRKVASLYVCVNCYEVMKSIAEKPRSEARQIIENTEKETCELLLAKGFQDPIKCIEDHKKYIQEKGR